MGEINKEENNGKQKAEPSGSSLWRIIMYSDWKDALLMTVGTMGCVADGSSLALTTLVVSIIMDGYSVTSLSPKFINECAMILVCIAIGVGLGGFLEGFCWARTAERQASRLRSKYLQAVLTQDVEFFDTSGGASMTSIVVSTISKDTLTIQGLLSDKMPNFLMNMAMFMISQMAALWFCWRLAIVAIPTLCIMIIPGMLYGKVLARIGKKMHEAYAIAGGIVEQSLSSIRIVYSYVAEERTEKRFSSALEPTVKLAMKQGLIKGMTIGTIGTTYAIWALQGWYGSVLLMQHRVRTGEIFATGVCIVYGGFALMGALGTIGSFTEANLAATLILDMIERVPTIDSAKQGTTIPEVKGELEFKEIDFAYPSRPGSLVLSNFNLRVLACQTVGLVGASGSGKSTVINLLERFYDPLGGKVLMDGIDIKALPLKWLRNQMALVDQEPVLFATSIKENILFGKSEASEEEMVEAAKAANAHDFITKLPKGYDTLVGQLGTQMSGGQKQRISIARALLRNPKILLLDEATSSLDSQSEKAVQDALSQASFGRTTIVIAHRLSTLRNADSIAVVQSGRVVESGRHDQLIQNTHGPYSSMIGLQNSFVEDENVSVSKQIENIDDIAPIDVTKIPIPTPLAREKKKAQKQDKKDSSSTLPQLIKMIASEWKSALIGFMSALSYGAIQPLHSYCLGALISCYSINNEKELKLQTRIYCFAFLAFAVSAFITSVIQHYHFAVVGESLTKKVREAIFSKVMTFEIEWFDQENNSSGALCARLAADAAMVRTLVVDRFSLLAQAMMGISLAVIMGMVLAWKLAIVVVSIQPLMISAFYMRVTMMKSMSQKVLKAQNRSSELASEAVGNHRVITAYQSEEKVMALFENTQMEPKKESHKQSWYAGMGLFTSGFLNAATSSLIYWYGGKLMYNGHLSYKHLFQVFFILVSTGRLLAEAWSATSDLSNGINSLKSIFTILQRKSKMDPEEPDSIDTKIIKGEIELKEVEFYYPTRSKQMILKGLNLKVDAGQIVALVGQSGCGKSTVIKMIERFYDPSKGSVEIDGIDIKRYNLRALRSHIALVSQEPTLFAGTIQENIAYAEENVTEAEIIEAATFANAHEFISSMKDGYGTYCGERGLQLSGGQKQRIAIARAILKNPAILLLDEATSALDAKSERLVQDALEKTMVGRTCLVVAHRLSTVQKSNKISVIENGRIVEEGSHGELLARGENGTYYSFVKLQQHDTMKREHRG